MIDKILVTEVEKNAKKETRLQLAKAGGLILSSIVVNNLNWDILSFFPQLLSFYSMYELCNYLIIKGKNDYIINDAKEDRLYRERRIQWNSIFKT